MILSESLNKQIIALAPSYIAVSDAPNTWKELQANPYDSDGRIRIYNGASDNTIYGSKEVNYAFRAWHDSIHLQYKLSFQPEHEAIVALIHRDMIVGSYEKDLIYADVQSQVEHYVKYKAYVKDQVQCVMDYMKHGKIIRQY